MIYRYLEQVAFSDMKPFPRRSQLASLHNANLVIVKKEWVKKEKQRQAVKLKKQQQLQVAVRFTFSRIACRCMTGIILEQ